MNRFELLALTARASLLALSFESSSAVATPASIYVSPETGIDVNQGGSQDPVKTIPRAQEIVKYKIQTQHQSSVQVVLMAGVYHLRAPLLFTNEDSGNGSASVEYVGEPGARITGGLVTKLYWKPIGSNGVYVTTTPLNPYDYLPALDREGKPVANPVFRDLYVNGSPAIRARLPKLKVGDAMSSYGETLYWVQNGKLSYPGVPKAIGKIDVRNSIRKSFLGTSGASDCDNLTARHPVEIVTQQHWMQDVWRIGAFAEGPSNLSLYPCTKEYSIPGLLSPIQNAPFHLENSLDFLTDANEWYYDAESKLLYYKPPAGMDISQAEFMVPTMETILIVKGASPANPATNLTFRGITFENTTFYAPNSAGYRTQQAGNYFVGETSVSIQPSAVKVENASGLSFEGNIFRDVGAEGLQLGAATAKNRIVGNQLFFAGGNCLSVGNDLYTVASDGDLIQNNRIWSCGRSFGGSVGVWVKRARNAVIQGNFLRYLPYSGISVGWDWDNIDRGMSNNQIVGNDVWDFGQLMFDGGGIYTLGYQVGSLISGNRIGGLFPADLYPTNAKPQEDAAIYLDQGTSGYIVRDNLIRMVIPRDGNPNLMIFHHTCENTNWVTNNLINNYSPNWNGLDAETWSTKEAGWVMVNPVVGPAVIACGK